MAPIYNEYDEGDDPLEEEGYGQGNSTNDYAFAKNNSSAFFSKSTPFQRPLNTIDNEFTPTKSEEGRDFVVFLTTEEVIDGTPYPVDYQKEYFGNKEDAQGFIDSMKQNKDQADANKTYDGYIVPVQMEKEAEQRMNELINRGSTGERELPQGTDREGAYWSEAMDGDEMFDALNKVCKNRRCTAEEAVDYLVRTQNLDETEAEAILLAYKYANKPIKEKRIIEMGYPTNGAVVDAFIHGDPSPKKSKNLKIVHFPTGRGLVNYYTLLALIGEDGVAYYNYQTYSVTTSKIQGGLKWRLKEFFSKDFIEVDEEEIKAVAEGEDIKEFKVPPKNKKTSYNKLPMNPNYMQKPSWSIHHGSEEPEAIDPNFNPFEGEEIFKDEENE